MSVYKISNNSITLSIDSLGAELFSIIRNSDNKEYLHTKDNIYWNKVSPILFPFVGALNNDRYLYNGKYYQMRGHGYAMNSNFEPLKISDNSISLEINSNQETLRIFPFEYKLTVTYKLYESTIATEWKIKNIGKSDMYYSIGGHPAFLVPKDNFYIRLNKKPSRITGIIGRFADEKLNVIENIDFDGNFIKFKEGLFKNDALVFEDYEISEIAFCENKIPYVSVSFSSPAAGIWAPDKKGCPFVCIEPWFGRCDSVDFVGSLENKKWIRKLETGTDETLGYNITIMQ